MHSDLYTDGSRLDLAGPVGWACEVVSAGRRWRERGVLPSPSVALAELHAVVRGVELSLGAGATVLDVFSDSQDVLRLVAGQGGRLLAEPQIAASLARLEPLRERMAISWHKVVAHRPGCSGNAWVDQAARQALLDERARLAARARAQQKRRR